MKILILTPQLPYPPQQGTSLRNYHIIRGLAQRHEVTLLSFLEGNQTADPAAIAPLQALCLRVETVAVPPRSGMKRLWQLVSGRLPDMAHRLYSPVYEIALRRVLAESQFDVIQVEGIELARYMSIIGAASEARLIFDDHNAETELQRRNFLTDLGQPRRWVAAAYSWVQVRRLRRFERWACETADAVVAVSETDKKHLQSLAPSLQSPVSVIPNSIDVRAYQQPVAPESYDLVFSGKMDYRPNVDAVLWFAAEVWPLICAERPSTTWAIVGQKPHPRLEAVQGLPGVTVTGWVEQVQPYLAGAQVIVMPFRIGSGTRLKLIEAMAAGKAIVSTPIGAEGFPIEHDGELLLAETAEEMATAVLELLYHPQQRLRLGRAAQQFAQRYDWRQVVPLFEKIYT
ncbi:MAG: glycosyltransferase [Ardenticatenaceae bacterium]|nr:glycosyltransferase [Ardenticatenaceae bacterium]